MWSASSGSTGLNLAGKHPWNICSPSVENGTVWRGSAAAYAAAAGSPVPLLNYVSRPGTYLLFPTCYKSKGWGEGDESYFKDVCWNISTPSQEHPLLSLPLPYKGALFHGHVIKAIKAAEEATISRERGAWRNEHLLCVLLPADGRLAVGWTFCGT